MFNEEHEEEYWQRRWSERLGYENNVLILYVEPSKSTLTQVERNVTTKGKKVAGLLVDASISWPLGNKPSTRAA